MGTHRLLLLKKFLTKPCKTFSQQPTKPHLNTHFFQLTRTYTQSSVAYDSSLHATVILNVATCPKTSVVPLLEHFVREGNDVRHDEVRKIIRTLRRKNVLDRALEVSEWMTSKLLSHPISGDVAVQLDLIGQVHGVDAAEKFFREVDVHTETMYSTLLNCYVKANHVDKSLSHFKKMKNMGLAISPRAYNHIMTLYLNIGQVEKVPDLLIEMEDNGVSPDNVSYRICLQSYAVRSEFTSMENLLKTMESHARTPIDWLTYAVVGNYYIKGGRKENAIHYLEKAEDRLRDNAIGDCKKKRTKKVNAVGYNNLITMYANLGDVTQVMRLWKEHKASCEKQINIDYINVIGSLVKLDKIEEAETLLVEWESSGNLYDFRVPNVLLIGYTQKGLVEKAERMLQGIITKGRTPVPNTWSIIASGHIKCGDMDKALQSMKKALELGPQHQGWLPNPEVISSILIWLGESGDIEEVDDFMKLLIRVVPMDKEMYQTLVKANIRHGNEIDGILQRMKADNIDADEEMGSKESRQI